MDKLILHCLIIFTLIIAYICYRIYIDANMKKTETEQSYDPAIIVDAKKLIRQEIGFLKWFGYAKKKILKKIKHKEFSSLANL
ncbi:hypothetical protein FAM09_24685 [Niastella caeni]|uniref:Uncharacterized protein n=1 Tax=Niastella caeni TaxID=2569763 RepID=A0A4S8HIX6_9BACT|nr:hypothetical protein [Niastella caeni]THU34219.1 hypothetical protein FAM09_24685 [Niastella caeni]